MRGRRRRPGVAHYLALGGLSHASAFDYRVRGARDSGGALWILGHTHHVGSPLHKTRPKILPASWLGDDQSQMAACVRAGWRQERKDRVHAGSVGLFGWAETAQINFDVGLAVWSS